MELETEWQAAVCERAVTNVGDYLSTSSAKNSNTNRASNIRLMQWNARDNSIDMATVSTWRGVGNGAR